MKKRIVLSNREGVQYGATVPWSDTWVYFFTGKRKKLSLGPTYVGLERFKWDCERNVSDPKDKYDLESDKVVARIQDLNDQGVKWDAVSYVMPGCDVGLPEVVVNSPLLDKESIERATAAMLVQQGYVSPNVKLSFRWKNHKKSNLRVVPF